MRRAIGTICALIVGLQILVGIPLAVCFLFFLLVENGGVGPVAIELHAGNEVSAGAASLSAPPAGPTTMIAAVPPNVIPHRLPLPFDNPILQSRAQQGSPLAGTILAEAVGAEAEQQLFVAAFEKVAADSALSETPLDDSRQLNRPAEQAAVDAGALEAQAAAATEPINVREKAAQFAIKRLYMMAKVDEQAGEFERADQWRALARGLRAASASEPSQALDEPQ
jgi:hypothetical protein